MHRRFHPILCGTAFIFSLALLPATLRAATGTLTLDWFVPNNDTWAEQQTTSGTPPLNITRQITYNIPGGGSYNKTPVVDDLLDFGNFRLRHPHEIYFRWPISTDGGARSTAQTSGSLTVSATGGSPGTAEIRFHFWIRLGGAFTAPGGTINSQTVTLEADAGWDIDGQTGTVAFTPGGAWKKVTTPWTTVTLDAAVPFTCEAQLRSIIEVDGTPAANPSTMYGRLNAEADLTWAAVPFEVRGALGDENSGAYSIDLSDFGLAGQTFAACRLNTFPPDYDLLDLAGTGTAGYSGDGGAATAAEVEDPYEPIFDSAGNIYFTQHRQHVLRRVDATTGLITTIAGTGVGGYSGDGGPAASAQLNGATRLAIDSQDRLYIADQLNHRIRRIDLATGIINTVVGTGIGGSGAGDGGPATAAQISFPAGLSIAANGDLYIVESGFASLRKVSAATGVITKIAGIGVPFRLGDGGLASGAGLDAPLDVAVDGAGNVYIAEIGLGGGGSVVRFIDAQTGLISTYAGGGAQTTGSGAPTDFDFGSELFSLNLHGSLLYLCTKQRLYVINLATDQCHHLAGGGLYTSSTFFGGVGANLAGDLAVSDQSGNRLHTLRVLRGGLVLEDGLTSGDLASVAFLGGGIEATGSTFTGAATFSNLAAVGEDITLVNAVGLTQFSGSNLGSVGGDWTLTDNGSLGTLDVPSLQSVGGDWTLSDNGSLGTLDVPSLHSTGGDFIASNNAELDTINAAGLETVGGDFTLDNNDDLDTFAAPNLCDVTGDFTVANSAALTSISATSLETVGGGMTVGGNTSLTSLDLSGLTGVGGGMTVGGNTSLTSLDLSGLTGVGGGMTVGGNTSLTSLDLSGLTGVNGTFNVSNNDDLDTINAAGLVSVGGDFLLDNNDDLDTFAAPMLCEVTGDFTVANSAALTSASATNLETVGGDVTLIDNGSLTGVDWPALGSVGGDVTLTDNGTLAGVDWPALGSVGGDVTLTDNGTLAGVDWPALGSVGGSLIASNNAELDTINAAGLVSVGGDVSIDLFGAALDLSSTTSIGGNLTVFGGDGLETFAANIPEGSTALCIVDGSCQMDLTLGENAVDAGEAFTVDELPPAEQAPAAGSGPDASAVLLDPMGAYAFDFGSATFNESATLSFEVDLTTLSPEELLPLLSALLAGNATIAVKADGATEFTALPTCAPGAPATVGCVAVEYFDALDQSLPGVVGATRVRFTTLTSTFSSWGIVTYAEMPNAAYQTYIEGKTGPVALKGFEDDLDGDGLANGLEMALGLDAGDPGDVGNATGGTLDGTEFVLETPAVTGIDYAAEGSYNLTHWFPLTDSGTGGDVRFELDGTGETKGFARWIVSPSAP